MLAIEQVAQRLLESDGVMLTTHAAPDGDGIGSELALYDALRGLQRAVCVVHEGQVPPRFLFLPRASDALDWPTLPAEQREQLLRDVSLALVVDTHDWSMLGTLGTALQCAGTPTLFVDHHPVTRAPDPSIYCDPDATSAGEICWRLLACLGAPISPAAATCLYAAIAYDTNSFKYLRGRLETHRAAAELIGLGADTDAIYRHVFASSSRGKVEFLGELLRRFQCAEQGRVAWAAIPRDLVARTAVTRDDLRDAITVLLEIEGVELAITFHEHDDGSYKVSLRSKGRFPVSRVARRLGGGGHLFAAGACAPGPLETLTPHVLELVRDLMVQSAADFARE